MFDTLKTWLTELGAGAASKFLSSVAILVLGLMVIRLIMKLLKKTLEKSKLEKAAHSLITSLARVTMYTLLLLSTASALGIDASRVNVKATTEEHLGFTGSGEGMACHAVCLLEE